jgi:phosphate-selective porin
MVGVTRPEHQKPKALFTTKTIDTSPNEFRAERLTLFCIFFSRIKPSLTQSIGLCFASLSFALLSQASAQGIENGSDASSPTFGGRVLIDVVDSEGAEQPELIIRSSRLGVKGDINRDWQFKIDGNYRSSGQITLADAYIALGDPTKSGEFKLGRFKPPVSVDDRTSSRFTTTLERARFVDDFDLERESGIRFDLSRQQANLSASFSTSDTLERNYTLAAAYMHSLELDDQSDLHLGGSFRYRKLEVEGGPDYSDSAALIGSHSEFDASSDTVFFIEGVFTRSSFWVASEYSIQRRSSSSCCDFNTRKSGYAEFGYMLGGVRRFKSGRFIRPEVYSEFGSGGLGGLALVLRADRGDPIGSEEADFFSVTSGVDWWPNGNTRFGANVVIQERRAGMSNGQTDLGLRIRLQYDW